MGSGAGETPEVLRVGVAVRPLLSLLTAVQAEVARLDPGQLPARDAMDVVMVLDRMGRVSGAGKMAAAVRVADSSLWSRSGDRSAADWLAKTTGVGVGDAVRLLRSAEVVADAPETKDALARGDVSPQQAEVIARAEKLSPGKGRELLGKAGRVSLGELRNESNQFVAAASPETDAEKTERQRKARSLRTWTDDEGMGCGSWRVPPAAQARLLAQLDSARSEIFRDHRRAGDHESSEAYAADALGRMVGRAERTRTNVGDVTGTRTVGAQATTGGDTPFGDNDPGQEPDEEDWSFAKVIVRVDASALDRGELAAGEVCEVAGQGPIPVVDAWKMIDGGAFVAALSTRGTEIDKLVHLGRRPTALQRTALEWRNAGECCAEGCSSKARMEIDHVADWAATHRTELRELGWACGTHHDLKTNQGWTFGPVLPNGKRRLIPPDEAHAGPEPPADPTPITQAPSVAERAQTLADRARARSAHPSSRRSPTRGSAGQGGLFDSG